MALGLLMGLWLPGNPASWSSSVVDVKILIEVARLESLTRRPGRASLAQIVYLVFIRKSLMPTTGP